MQKINFMGIEFDNSAQRDNAVDIFYYTILMEKVMAKEVSNNN